MVLPVEVDYQVHSFRFSITILIMQWLEMHNAVLLNLFRKQYL